MLEEFHGAPIENHAFQEAAVGGGYIPTSGTYMPGNHVASIRVTWPKKPLDFGSRMMRHAVS